MADTLHDLALIIRSRFPVVQVETREETRIMKLLERVANLEGWALFVWTVADGLKTSSAPLSPRQRAPSGKCRS